ncbi:hypothetical protein SteCoe_26345 [Stentor coeruleus]|uniref:RING-type domain-containing protein n=1 Tax=Stentor coeruleus TaxID=5963 RepID=A0A1R2BD30_9CILI|nr:hypothetical protein SteCoe_26345 [Stentor coeruleus]
MDTSRVNPINNDNTEIHDIISCKICFEFLTPPVSQCLYGHITCNDCLSKLTEKKCPVCRRDMSKTLPNLILDSILSSFQVKCKFQDCHEIIKIPNLKTHYKVCEFNYEIPCPLSILGFSVFDPQCTHVYDARTMKRHLKDIHNLNVLPFDGTIDWGKIRTREEKVLTKVFNDNNMLFVAVLSCFDSNSELAIIPIICSKTINVKVLIKEGSNFMKIRRKVEGLRSPLNSAILRLSSSDIVTFCNGKRLSFSVSFS